jgi:hypothetical protein
MAIWNLLHRRTRIGEKNITNHFEMAASIFDPKLRFEDVAAVTELHFCAHCTTIPTKQGISLCADTFFGRVFTQVQPKVIVTRGVEPEKYLRKHFLVEGSEKGFWGSFRKFAIEVDGVRATVFSLQFSMYEKEFVADEIKKIISVSPINVA